MNYEYASCEEMKEIKEKGPLSLDANYLYMYTNLKSYICYLHGICLLFFILYTRCCVAFACQKSKLLHAHMEFAV